MARSPKALLRLNILWQASFTMYFLVFDHRGWCTRFRDDNRRVQVQANVREYFTAFELPNFIELPSLLCVTWRTLLPGEYLHRGYTLTSSRSSPWSTTHTRSFVHTIRSQFRKTKGWYSETNRASTRITEIRFQAPLFCWQNELW